jgi:hypothetical protein
MLQYCLLNQSETSRIRQALLLSHRLTSQLAKLQTSLASAYNVPSTQTRSSLVVWRRRRTGPEVVGGAKLVHREARFQIRLAQRERWLAPEPSSEDPCSHPRRDALSYCGPTSSQLVPRAMIRWVDPETVRVLPAPCSKVQKDISIAEREERENTC